MSNDNGTKIISISGGILIFVTVLIYAIGCRDIIKVPTIVALSFFFVVLAEVTTFYVMLKTKMEILRSGVITVMILYLFSTVILALLFVNLFIRSLTLYAIINLVIMGVVAIVVLNLNGFVDHVTKAKNKTLSVEHVTKANNKTLSAEIIMGQCQDRIQSYLNDSQYSQYKKQLNKIYEDVKYSDISSGCGMEGELLLKIEGISENKDNILEYVQEISFLIKERNIKIKRIKRGSI